MAVWRIANSTLQKPEGEMGKRFRRNEFWDRLEQALVLIGR